MAFEKTRENLERFISTIKRTALSSEKKEQLHYGQLVDEARMKYLEEQIEKIKQERILQENKLYVYNQHLLKLALKVKEEEEANKYNGRRLEI